MSAKTAQDSRGPIIYDLSFCGNFRTGMAQDGPKAGPQDTTLAARFWAKVDRKSPLECWPWLAGTRGGGYGSFKVAGKHRQAHHVAWELANGEPIPAGLLIRHACDNRPCCNPAHLVPGTQKQNVADAVSRGRHVNPDWRMRRTIRNQHGYSRKVAA